MVPSSIGQDTWFSSSKEGFDSPRDRHYIMSFYVYIIKTFNSKVDKTYVGYTNNLKKRLFDHNNKKGAKATKGHYWKLIFKKRFYSKSKAMSYEYKIKNDKLLRQYIINNCKNSNLHF